MIHWFYTVGNAARDAAYVRAGTAAPVVEQRYVTPALLELGWPVSREEFPSLALHMLATREVLADCAPLLDALRAISPRLVDDADLDPARALDRRNQEAIWQVVAEVLSKVQDGDEVVLEITNGIRSITTGFLLASGLLLAARPGVTVRAVTYAELGADELPSGYQPRSPGVNRASPIYDLLPFLRLFAWSQAVHAMTHYLDPSPTLALVRGEKPSSPQTPDAETSLEQLASALALNLPMDIEQALQQWRQLRSTIPDFSPAARLTLDHIDASLASLDAPASGRDVLTVDHLRFDLVLIDRLVAAQRLGDAARAMREWMVNAVIVAWGEGAGWLDHERVRAKAETALHGLSPKGSPLHAALRAQWMQASQLRNAVSHLGYNEKHDVAPGQLEVFLKSSPQQARALLEAQGITAFNLPRAVPRGYLANAFSLNMLEKLDVNVRISRLSLDKARVAAADLPSIVGHADTASLFARLLGREVALARETVVLGRGDHLVVGQYSGPRLEQGATSLPDGATVRWAKVELS